MMLTNVTWLGALIASIAPVAGEATPRLVHGTRDGRSASMVEDLATGMGEGARNDSGGVAGGQPNDACASAFPLFDGVTPFSTLGATTDGPAMPGHPDCDAHLDNNVHQDIWYNYTATCTSTLRVSTCSDANFDTKIAIYSGTGCPVTHARLIGCNDDGGNCQGATSIVEASVVQGDAYKIRVGGYFSAMGSGSLTVTCGGGSCFPDFTVTAPGTWAGSTCGANDDCDVLFSDNEDHLYQVTVPSSGDWTFSLCGSSYNTKLMIGTTCCGDEIGYTDDFCGLQSEITVSISAGTYFVAVDGFGGECGPYTLQIRSADGPCPAGAVIWIDPPDGVVDARQPHPVGSMTPLQGIDTIEVSAPVGADAACWRLCETDDGGNPNDIAGVVDHGDGTYTISLVRPITPGAVTMLTYTPDKGLAVTASFIAHPSNVNGDSGAFPLDILKEIDCVNGVEPGVNCPWGLYSCDANHSAECNSGDILRVIDLLNGADTFQVWNATDLPVNDGSCP